MRNANAPRTVVIAGSLLAAAAMGLLAVSDAPTIAAQAKKGEKEKPVFKPRTDLFDPPETGAKTVTPPAASGKGVTGTGTGTTAGKVIPVPRGQGSGTGTAPSGPPSPPPLPPPPGLGGGPPRGQGTDAGPAAVTEPKKPSLKAQGIDFPRNEGKGPAATTPSTSDGKASALPGKTKPRNDLPPLKMPPDPPRKD